MIDEELQVHQSRKEDVFYDIIRVHKKIIGDPPKLKKHRVVRVKTNGETKFLWLRSIEQNDIFRINEENEKCKSKLSDPKKWILMDEHTRDYFRFNEFKECDFYKHCFNIQNASILGKLKYCKNHSNPIIKYPFLIASFLSIISVVLGLIATWSISSFIMAIMAITIAIGLIIILIIEW